MAATITCPYCQRRLRLPAECSGATVQCPLCQGSFAADDAYPAALPVAGASPPPDRRPRQAPPDRRPRQAPPPPRRGGRRWALWTVILLGALGLAVVVIILPPAKPAIILPPAKPAVVLPPAKTRLLYSIPWQDVRQGFPAHIYTTGISSDGRLFFGAGDAGPTGAIRVFDLATGKQVQEFLPDGDLWFTVPVYSTSHVPRAAQR